jgi:hypothetical protein
MMQAAKDGMRRQAMSLWNRVSTILKTERVGERVIEGARVPRTWKAPRVFLSSAAVIGRAVATSSSSR